MTTLPNWPIGLKILLLHNRYREHGGEDEVVAREADLLSRRGHTIIPYFRDNANIRNRWDRACVALGTPYNIFARRALERTLRREKPDVVHVHNFFPQFSPSIFDACLDTGTPCVQSLHNFRILCPTALLYQDEALRERSLTGASWWTVPRRVYRDSLWGSLALASMVEYHKRAKTWLNKVDAYIALTNFAKQKFVSGGLPAERIYVRGNFVPDPGEPPPHGERRGALFVGRLSPEKGVQLLVEAWKEIDYPLTIAGDGPLRSTIDATRTDATTLLGRVDRARLVDLMRRSSFLIVPSNCYEMYGLVVVEAFSCGLPVIVSRLGGLAELVSPDLNGLHFAAGDVRALRAAVQWAIDNPKGMAAMSKSARHTFEECHSERQNYDQLMSVYSRVIRSR